MPTKRDEQESRVTTKEEAAEPSVTGSARERTGTTGRTGAGAAVTSRHPQFMLLARGIAGFQPVAGPEFLEQSLRNSQDIEVLETLSPRNAFDVLGGMPGSHKVLVAKMDEQKAWLFASQAGHQVFIERDHLLNFDQNLGFSLRMAPAGLQHAVGFTATFKVTAHEVPVEDAEVCIVGSSSLTQGVTDRQGELQLGVSGELPATIRALYINPRADFWSVWIPEPAINPSGENVITVTPLHSTFSGFPKHQLVGWGHKAMKIEQLPPSYRGKGIKIGIIDSGIATGHSALRGQVKSGYDATMKSQQGWDEDAIGHGTHCAGIICGRSPSGSGIHGVAPEAELVVCKVSPGGSYSSLLEAFDFCIAQQVDVIHVSVTGPEPSQILEQKIMQAKQLGIACIAAAGDSGDSVEYPASSPNVLTVGALGKQGEFPAQSYHALSMGGFAAPSGFFSPNFSCFGPQVAVCAPGIAVVSSVPPDNFAPRDGTAVAAAYITGLAALILAHHPEFQPQGVFSTRTAFRVERLFQLIRQSAQPIQLGNPFKVGAGLPDATLAMMSAPVRPDFTSLLPHGVVHPGVFSPTMAAGFPLSAGSMSSAPGAPPLRPNGALPQANSLAPDWLMAIQQIRMMMQSAGLL